MHILVLLDRIEDFMSCLLASYRDMRVEASLSTAKLISLSFTVVSLNPASTRHDDHTNTLFSDLFVKHNSQVIWVRSRVVMHITQL